MCIDVWEHAYYLQYKNDRKTYLHEIWKIINWKNVTFGHSQIVIIEKTPINGGTTELAIAKLNLLT